MSRLNSSILALAALLLIAASMAPTAARPVPGVAFAKGAQPISIGD